MQHMPKFEEKPEALSFEEQYKNFEEVRLPSGTAEVGDFTPEGLKDETPVFFAPSWSLGLKTYEPAFKQLFEGAEADGKVIANKRRVISLSHPRIGGSLDSSMNVEELSAKYSDAELRKALNILEVLEEKGIEQVDAITHSEAAINVAIAAMIYPEKFRSIVFDAPAGMMEEETWMRLSKGFTSQGKDNEWRKAEPEIPITEIEKKTMDVAGKEGLKYFLSNPGRGIAEIRGIKTGHRTTLDIIPYLHELGIGIVIMTGKDDPVFPEEQIQKAMDLNVIDKYISIRGDHGIINGHPEMGIVEAEMTLEELAKKERTPEQKAALRARPNQAGVRYIPGEGLKIAPYIKNSGALQNPESAELESENK
jgi:pimeloyl-ACP methyl ester carboxylesterase